MKNQLWAAVHQTFDEVGDLCLRAESSGEEESALQVFVNLRSAIRGRLNHLKTRLAEFLSEREGYCVLFPIVVHFDELVLTRLVSKRPAEWPLLQKELFEVDNGGELVYEMMEDLLRKPDTHPFIFELFYFCLAEGFKGKYEDDSVRIAEYQRKLRVRIPAPDVPLADDRAQEDAIRIQARRFPWWLYVAAAIGVAATYFGLRKAAGTL